MCHRLIVVFQLKQQSLKDVMSALFYGLTQLASVTLTHNHNVSLFLIFAQKKVIWYYDSFSAH